MLLHNYRQFETLWQGADSDKNLMPAMLMKYLALYRYEYLYRYRQTKTHDGVVARSVESGLGSTNADCVWFRRG